MSEPTGAGDPVQGYTQGPPSMLGTQVPFYTHLYISKGFSNSGPFELASKGNAKEIRKMEPQPGEEGKDRPLFAVHSLETARPLVVARPRLQHSPWRRKGVDMPSAVQPGQACLPPGWVPLPAVGCTPPAGSRSNCIEGGSLLNSQLPTLELLCRQCKTSVPWAVLWG